MTYDPQIHHRQSYRLKGYDYSLEGLYFVTVCVQDKKCLFGKIEEGEMKMNDVGKMVEECWASIPQHYPNVRLLESIIMPNHIHGIIQIVGAEYLPPEYTNIANKDIGQTKNIPSQRGTLGSIIKGFKIGVTKQIGYSIWQRNYYEHIIRNQRSYEEIADYIVTNPLRWEKDKLYSD